MAKYQTADEWLKTQRGASGGSGGQYQTAEEWLSKNARSINETHFAVKREANQLREEWAGRRYATNQGRAIGQEQRPAQQESRAGVHARRKQNAILQEMMDDDAARARDEYEAAYRQYQQAEQNYYTVPDGDFQKVEDDFLAADERLRTAQRRMNQANQASKDTAKAIQTGTKGYSGSNDAVKSGGNAGGKQNPYPAKLAPYSKATRTSAEILEEKAGVDQEVDELRKQLRTLQQQQAGYSRSFTIGNEERERVKTQIEEVQAALKEAESRQGELELSANLAQRREKITAYDQYREEADFSSVAEEAKNAGGNWKSDPLGYYHSIHGYGDSYITMGGQSSDPNNWRMLQDDEEQMYYYLLGSQGTKAAKQYLNDLQIELDRRSTAAAQKRTAELYQSSNDAGKFAWNALTVPANVFGSISAPLGDAVSVLSGKGYNPYNSGHNLTDFASTIRGERAADIEYAFLDDETKALQNELAALTQEEIKLVFSGSASMDEFNDVKQKIEEVSAALEAKEGENSKKIPWGKIASNTYQAVMSGADSALGATLFGNGYTTIMGAGAASQRARELWEAGVPDAQIGMGAIASGLIEMATEKYSIEYFTGHFLEGDITGFKDWATKTLIQGLNEGSEEVASELANMVADALILGANSDNQREIRELMESGGLSYDEAEKQAYMNRVIDVLWAGYGGAVSGGTMGGFGGALNKAVQINRDTVQALGAEQAASETNAKAAAQGQSKQEGNGFTVQANAERGTTEISFPEKPPQAVQEALKENGFRWSKTDKVWYGQRSEEEARRIVLDAGGELFGKSGQSGQSEEAAPAGQEENQTEITADHTIPSAPEEDSGQIDTNEKPDAISKPFRASDNGATLLNLPDGSTVETEITGIASNEPGKLMLNVAGQEEPVSAGSISYADAGEASVYYFIDKMKLMPAAADMIVEQAKNFVQGTDGLFRAEKMADFASNLFGMYSLGESGIPAAKAMSSLYAGGLNETMAEAGYQLGRRIYDQNVQAKEAQKQALAASQRARAATGGQKVNGVRYDGLNVRQGRDGTVEIDGVALNEQQKTGIQAAELLGSMGVNIHIFQSRLGTDGKPVGENGSYHMADGSIHIDLNAGADGQGVMAYTISHELTHFMEDQQPAQFQKFSDALFEDLETDIREEIANMAEELKRQQPDTYKNASQDKLTADARSEVVAEACETMLTDTDAARQIAQRIQAQDASLWEKIVQWFKDFEQKLRSAYNGLKPGSGIAKDAKKTLQQVDGLVKMWADMAVDSAENYREAVPKDAGATYDDAMYSIRRTSNMSWGQQIKSTLNHNGKIQHMDTLVVMNNTPAYLLTGDTANLPMAIPLSVITKAQKGKNADHAISDKNLIALQYGMENAIAVIDNPARNSLAFITSLEEDGGKVAVFFDKNVQFDGDQVNKATSIHRRTNIVGLINNLPDNAIIYVKNKNEFDTLVGMADSIPAAYKGKIKFVDGSIAQGDDSVNRSGVINKKFSQRNSEGRTEEQNASGPYSYESLISKPDMAVTTLPEKVPKSRADVVYQAKQNAAKIGKFNTKDGSVSVYVEDTGHNVVLSTNGLKHSLDRRFDTNASVVVEAGNILANSIKINEMTPKRSDANESYILIGSAIGNNGDMYIVRSVVNSFKNELVSMDVLYAVNAKKMEPAAQMPRLAEKSTIRTGSTISISELLENVNEYFPDILPEDVLRHFGHDSRPEGKLGESALYSARKAETEESHKEELAETRARLSKEDQERRENILRDYQKSRKISVENWRMTELGILKSAAENIASLDLSEREKKWLENFSGHLKKLEGIQGEIDAIRSKEGELSQQDLKKLTSLEQQADSMRKLLWEFSEYDVLKKVSQKTRKLLMDKYGSIKPGENPSRQADIPIQTNDLNRVSQTVRTAVEASATSDEMAEKIRQKVVEGEFSYLPITDDASNKRAEETINRKGWDDALDDWKVQMSKTNFPGKDMVALGFQLYNNSVNKGNTKEALRVLTQITNTVRNSAQVVQAVRILKKLSPENRLYAIQRQLSSLQDDLNKKYGDKAPQINMNSALAENYRNAKGEENIRAAEEALFRNIAAQLPNTFADKWNSWRYLSMLGNVRTHVRNIVGNVGFVPVRTAKDTIAAGMEAAVDKISKNGIDRTKSVLNPLNEADRALYTAGMNDYAAAEELLASANLKSGDSISRIEQYKPAFGGDKAIWRALSKVAEANSNALSFEDMIFKKTTYASAFAGYLKANDVTAKMLQNGEAAEDFLDKARTYAFEEALKATYNDFNDFSNFVAKLGRLSYSGKMVGKAAGFLAEGVLPFKRTPANILVRSIEYSPVGLANGIKKSLVDVRHGKATAAEAIDTLASGFTGTMLLGLGGLLASMGLVSGGDDDDDKQAAFDKLRGKQSYALNVFGKSYTIDWLAPEVIPMFVGVELYNTFSEKGGIGVGDFLEALQKTSNPLLEMSMLQSLNDLLDSISYSDNKLYAIVSQSAANHVLQAVPTLFGQLERIGETEREQTYIDRDSQIPKDVQYTLAKAANKIPGVEFDQIPYIDAYGRRQETGNLGTRMFSNLLSPGYLSSDRSAPWDDELERLHQLGFTSVYPQKPTTKINQKELTAQEYVDHATFTGQERYRLLGLVLDSDYYKSKNDAEKAEIIEDVYSYIAAEGKYRYDEESTIPKWTKVAMKLEGNGGSFIDVLKGREEDRGKNGNLTKEQCVEYIKNNFPEDQWEEVWETMKVKNWTNKDTPWE